MSKKEIKYTDEEIGEVKFINDFLPPPEDLVLKEETVKITLALTKESVDFFKKIAKEQETHYQTMIRSLLDQYTERFDKTRRVTTRAGKFVESDSSNHKVKIHDPKGKKETLRKPAKNLDRHAK